MEGELSYGYKQQKHEMPYRHRLVCIHVVLSTFERVLFFPSEQDQSLNPSAKENAGTGDTDEIKSATLSVGTGDTDEIKSATLSVRRDTLAVREFSAQNKIKRRCSSTKLWRFIQMRYNHRHWK